MAMIVNLIMIFPSHLRMGCELIGDFWRYSLPSAFSSIFSPSFGDDNGMHSEAKDGLL
jgi:hypothetical protein